MQVVNGPIRQAQYDATAVKLTGNQTISGEKTWTDQQKLVKNYANYVLENNLAAQYAGAGFNLYNSAATMAGAAGVQAYAGISNVGVTQGYFNLQLVDRTGAYLDQLVGWDLASKLMQQYGDFEITPANGGVILKAPNGSKYKVTVNNTGNLVTTGPL